MMIRSAISTPPPWWSLGRGRYRRDLDVGEADPGVLRVETERPGPVGRRPVGVAGQVAAVGSDVDLVADLHDPDPVPAPDREGGGPSGGQEALAARVARVLLGQLPAGRLERERVEPALAGVV